MELPIGEVASNSLLFGFDQVLWLHNGTLYLHSLKSLFYSWPNFLLHRSQASALVIMKKELLLEDKSKLAVKRASPTNSNKSS